MKKKFMLLALVAMFVCGGAFARPPMYAGVEMGYGSMSDLDATIGGFNVGGHFGGFEAVPVFGISPFSKLPNLALEFNLMMDFLQHKTSETGSNTTTTIKGTVITPQILAVYTFAEGPVRPFLGAGLGVNINSAEYSRGGVSTKIELGPSFSLVAKAGAVATIPNTKFDLLFLARYNLNISAEAEISVGGTTTKYDGRRMNLSSLSFALGARYNF